MPVRASFIALFSAPDRFDQPVLGGVDGLFRPLFPVGLDVLPGPFDQGAIGELLKGKVRQLPFGSVGFDALRRPQRIFRANWRAALAMSPADLATDKTPHRREDLKQSQIEKELVQIFE